MKKRGLVRDIFLAAPGTFATVEQWGGRVLDILGLPGAAEQFEQWRAQYFPEIGAGTYWLIGFSLIGLTAAHFWPRHEQSPPPETSKTSSNEYTDDGDIVKIRSDIMRLVRTLSDYGSPEQQRETVFECMARIEKSDHAVWLNRVLSKARVDFLHWCGVAQYERQQSGVIFSSRESREEVLFYLKDAELRLEAGLTGQPIPLEAEPPKKAPVKERVPITELRDMAKENGWDFSDESMELIDLADALRQAGADGKLKIWGRKDKYNGESVHRNEPLYIISPEHWENFRIDIYVIQNKSDNFYVCTRGNSGIGYWDLHVEYPPLLGWLKNEGEIFRGRNET